MPSILRNSRAKAALALANNYVTLGAEHETDTANPHVVTKTQIGLGNVDNTTDANKPVSTAQQTALDLKANIASPTFTGTVSGIDKTMVGLGNVDNTSDLDKPVSTATTTAIGNAIDATDIQDVYENSTTPEIQTDATRGAFTVQENTADDTANVYEGKNNTGTTTFSVNGRGEVEFSAGWNDLVSYVSTAKLPPSSAPTWANFAPSAGRQEASFAIGDYVWLSPYHIQHDIDPSAAAHLHVHWSTDGTDTNDIKWELKYIRAKGHGQAAFPTETTINIVGTPNGTAWTHYVHESTTDLVLTEPDELILVTLKRVTNGGVENTDAVFGLMVDIHYEVTRTATPNKAPNFYT